MAEVAVEQYCNDESVNHRRINTDGPNEKTFDLFKLVEKCGKVYESRANLVKLLREWSFTKPTFVPFVLATEHHLIRDMSVCAA